MEGRQLICASQSVFLLNKMRSMSIINPQFFIICFCTLFLAALSVVFDIVLPFFALVFFIIVTAMSFIKPSRMFIFSLFISLLIPLDLSLKTESIFRIGPTRIILAAFLLGFLFRFISPRTFIWPKLPRLYVVFFGLFIAAGFVSSIFSVAPRVSFNALIGRDILEQFLMFYLFFLFFNKNGFFKKLKTFIFLATAIICLFSFYEVLAQNNPLFSLFQGASVQVREGIPRVRSTFFHPIALGCYINLVFPFVVIDFIKKKDIIKRVFLSLLLLMMFVTSFFTVSRAPWICLFIELFIIAAWQGFKNHKRIVVTAFLLLICFLILIVAYLKIGPVHRFISPMFSASQQEKTSSEYYRVALIRAVRSQMHGERLIYGYGPNAFYLANGGTEVEKKTKAFESPDNHYLRILQEYGITGLILFLILIFFSVYSIFKAIRKAKEKFKLLAVGCLASALGFLILNASVSMFTMYPLGALFWMSIALSRVLLAQNTQ